MELFISRLLHALMRYTKYAAFSLMSQRASLTEFPFSDRKSIPLSASHKIVTRVHFEKKKKTAWKFANFSRQFVLFLRWRAHTGTSAVANCSGMSLIILRWHLISISRTQLLQCRSVWGKNPWHFKQKDTGGKLSTSEGNLFHVNGKNSMLKENAWQKDTYLSFACSIHLHDTQKCGGSFLRQNQRPYFYETPPTLELQSSWWMKFLCQVFYAQLTGLLNRAQVLFGGNSSFATKFTTPDMNEYCAPADSTKSSLLLSVWKTTIKVSISLQLQNQRLPSPERVWEVAGPGIKESGLVCMVLGFPQGWKEPPLLGVARSVDLLPFPWI